MFSRLGLALIPSGSRTIARRPSKVFRPLRKKGKPHLPPAGPFSPRPAASPLFPIAVTVSAGHKPRQPRVLAIKWGWGGSLQQQARRQSGAGIPVLPAAAGSAVSWDGDAHRPSDLPPMLLLRARRFRSRSTAFLAAASFELNVRSFLLKPSAQSLLTGGGFGSFAAVAASPRPSQAPSASPLPGARYFFQCLERGGRKFPTLGTISSKPWNFLPDFFQRLEIGSPFFPDFGMRGAEFFQPPEK
ncbi:MAG: hypothetical protein AB7E95_06580 [Kiritimatiellales bacterium]